MRASDFAALHRVAVAMEDLDDLARHDALHVDLHLGLHVADLGDLDLDVGDFGLADLDRQLRLPASCRFAFMATNVTTIATARTMIDHTASFFLRFPLIGRSSNSLLPD